jgi:hypothetical protein
MHQHADSRAIIRPELHPPKKIAHCTIKVLQVFLVASKEEDVVRHKSQKFSLELSKPQNLLHFLILLVFRALVARALRLNAIGIPDIILRIKLLSSPLDDFSLLCRKIGLVPYSPIWLLSLIIQKLLCDCEIAVAQIDRRTRIDCGWKRLSNHCRLWWQNQGMLVLVSHFVQTLGFKRKSLSHKGDETQTGQQA